MLFGKAPSYSHLRTFGCLCYATVPISHKDKLKARVMPCVFLGFPFAKKGYKLYNLQSRQCFVSRDVLFHEHHFHFSHDFPFPKIMAPTTSKLPVTSGPPFSLDNSSSVPSFVTSTDNSHLSSQTVSYSSPFPISSYPTPPVNSNSLPDCSYPSFSFSFSPDTVTPSSSTHVPPVTLRKSERSHTQPSYLKDYICQLPPFFSGSITQQVDFEPYTYSQVAPILACQNAMTREFEALEYNNTWVIIELPKGKKSISCKWVYKIKYKANGEVERYKSRLVIGETHKLKGWISMRPFLMR